MRKGLKSVCLSIIILVSLLVTSCGVTNKNVSEASGTKTEKETATASPAAASVSGYTLPIAKQPITLTWMGRDSEEAGFSFNTNKSVVWEELQKKTGITIKWDVIPNQEYKEQMQIRFASNSNLPDIACAVGDADGSYLVKLSTDKILRPLNDLIEKNAPNLKKLLQDFPQYKNALTLPDGNIVSLADLNASNYRAKTMLIRKDWLDKLKLPEVKSIDDLYNTAKAFKEKDPNGNGQQDEYGIGSLSLIEYRQIGMAFGLSLVTGSGWSVRNGKVTYEFILPEYKAFLEWMNRAYKEGLLAKDYQTADSKVYTSRINNNQLGISAREYITNFISFNDPEKATQKNTPGAVWMPIRFATGQYGKPTIPQESAAGVQRTYGITTACKYPVEAIQFLDYIMAGDGKIINQYGVEGVTYNMKNGLPTLIADWKKNVPNGTFIGNGYAIKITDDTLYKAQFDATYLLNNQELRKWTIDVSTAIANETYSPFQPPIPTLEDAKKVSQIYGDLNTYRDEMFVKFINGEYPLSKFDDYVKQMKSLGIDEITKIYQKGYDNLKK